VGDLVDQLSEWSAISEWDLDLSCTASYHADVTNTSGTQVIGSQSEISHYQLLARLKQTGSSYWDATGDAKASWSERWQADASGSGFTMFGWYTVEGQGHGEGRASLRMGSLLRDDQPPLPVYSLEASGISIPITLTSYDYSYTGIPADQPSEYRNQSSGTRTVYVPGIYDWPLPLFEEGRLVGSQQVPFGLGQAQVTWSVRPAGVGPVLRDLSVIDGATQRNVSDLNSWATTRKRRSYIVVEATTAPENNAAEWKKIKWSGAGQPVPGQPNQRRLSRAESVKLTVTATLNESAQSIDIWVMWAQLSVLTGGMRPANAAPFDDGLRDGTQKLGAVTYPTIGQREVGPGVGVGLMTASGKVAVVGEISPPGVGNVVKSGWAIERQVKAREWRDGFKVKAEKNWTDDWAPDTSLPKYLRLEPDDAGRIYDLDAPGLGSGETTFETYNNFRQWVTWNDEKCSDYAPWHWWSRWHLAEPSEKQVTLQDLGAGRSRSLPSDPFYPKK
jgi:hypothetical protein